MIQTYRYNNLTWIDLESPSRDEISKLVKERDLHPLVGENILSKSSKPRVEHYGEYIYLVIHIPIRIKKDDRFSVEQREIDFIIGEDFIITTKYDTIEPLVSFSKAFETNSIIDRENLGDHAGYIFYYMMKKLYAHMLNDLDSIRAALLLTEDKIFAGEERKMVEVLSNLSRELIDLKQISRIHKEVLDSFAPIAYDFFGADFKFYIDDILHEYSKIHEIGANNRELVVELRETNDSLLSAKQNEITQVLTTVAFITFPLSLVAGIFSMDTIHNPIIGLPHDFAIVMAIMAVMGIAMIGYFKYKKWL